MLNRAWRGDQNRRVVSCSQQVIEGEAKTSTSSVRQTCAVGVYDEINEVLGARRTPDLSGFLEWLVSRLTKYRLANQHQKALPFSVHLLLILTIASLSDLNVQPLSDYLESTSTSHIMLYLTVFVYLP